MLNANYYEITRGWPDNLINNTGKKLRAIGRNPKLWRETVLKLAERDGENCFHCRKPMIMAFNNERLSSNGVLKKQAVTIEHLIPRSEGGSHALWNLRLVHNGCNK